MQCLAQTNRRLSHIFRLAHENCGKIGYLDLVGNALTLTVEVLDDPHSRVGCFMDPGLAQAIQSGPDLSLSKHLLQALFVSRSERDGGEVDQM